MASFEQASLCSKAEYEQALIERMLYGQLQNGEIAMLFLRLQNREDALKTPIQLRKPPSSRLGDFALDITLLDGDLKPINKTPITGAMPDGIWNSDDPDRAIIYRSPYARYQCSDGVLRPYDDGIDMTAIENMLARSGLA